MENTKITERIPLREILKYHFRIYFCSNNNDFYLLKSQSGMFIFVIIEDSDWGIIDYKSFDMTDMLWYLSDFFN